MSNNILQFPVKILILKSYIENIYNNNYPNDIMRYINKIYFDINTYRSVRVCDYIFALTVQNEIYRFGPNCSSQLKIMPEAVCAYRSHIYRKPKMYIGSIDAVMSETRIYDFTSQKPVEKVIMYIPACERLFLEVLDNATDNAVKSKHHNIDPGSIDILMDTNFITIINKGLPVPIQIHSNYETYIPELIFGVLQMNSNYIIDYNNLNGIGVKTVNIFSTEFIVIICDHIRHLKYIQVWFNNMIVKTNPIIEQYYGTQSSVQVTYKLDFERFKMQNNKLPGYSIESFQLYANHALNKSLEYKIAVSFNGTIL